ncbi:MAG: endonuclease/exonuclease/phosphatase family protein [Flavobacteriales bacterium]|nr:endonuclease/exonuclease/phosphatase family protein [Flavobacteriales bacterium]
MKIINWNVGRPNATKAARILERLNSLDGDIVVLTETDVAISPQGCVNVVSTDHLPFDLDGDLEVPYRPGERRAMIWTKYSVIKTYQTRDEHTSVCAEIETPFGNLTVYATIIGVFNGLRPRFKLDLQRQMLDFEAIFPERQVAIIGDLNTTFSGRIYPSHVARETLDNAFKKFDLENVTSSIPGAVDHIAISSEFIRGKRIEIETWNEDRKLSDHIGFSATITASHSKDV